MTGNKSGGSDSWLGNPNVLLAVVTIAGGLWLVSQKLTSDRPVPLAGRTVDFIGDQKLEARLWEDPFKGAGSEGKAKADDNSNPSTSGLDELVDQIARRTVTTANPDVAYRVLVLPVMVSGGHYSEDQESRIRSRFAIVSALGRANFVPEDAEHLGVVQVPWLTQKQMHQAMREEALDSGGAGSDRLLGIKITDASGSMDVHYEWYRPRAFAANSAGRGPWTSVMVLWLNDSYFEDEPLLRLPMLLERIVDPGSPPSKRAQRPDVRVIGPRRSATLRHMLRNWSSKENAWPKIPYCLKSQAQAVLNHVSLYCATPSAMDEVLVQHPDKPDETPRESIKSKLQNAGFKAVHNFSATDAQMAREVLAELDLRGADLKEGNNHVVLISEWDTFYARMLSLTYGAELALFQQGAKAEWATVSRADFINAYISRAESDGVMPENFHSLVYLRGLDGQTVQGNNAGGDNGSERGRTSRPLPASLNDLRLWVPDVNKAEGPAQFDYLGRLGDRVEEIQQSLERKDSGRIAAIGIVGSDVYDTLLILQALRNRFPDVLFFTTDLDVRFLHPRERDWARNLIVASSYGLALHPTLQGAVAPFRDSTQTAQFAAALAALGNDGLTKVGRIQPRRFEVGNSVAVDLSVNGAPAAATPAEDLVRLHPLTASESITPGRVSPRA